MNIILKKIISFKDQIGINRYANEFVYYLARDHGVNGYYNVDQIESTITKYSFSSKLNYYAYCLFLNKTDYNKLFKDCVNLPSYHNCRQRIASILGLSECDLQFDNLISKSRYKDCVITQLDENNKLRYQFYDRAVSGKGGSDASIGS